MSTQSTINPAPLAEAIAGATTTAALLRRLGHEVVELDTMPFDDAALARDFLTSWFAWQVDHARTRAGASDADFEADTHVMGLGRGDQARRPRGGRGEQHQYVRSLAAFHREYDLLLTPTTATPPRASAPSTCPNRCRKRSARWSRCARRVRCGSPRSLTR